MQFKSELGPFRTQFAENIFKHKYGHAGTWANLAKTVVDDVCGSIGGTSLALLTKNVRDQLTKYITEMKFIPGGRYLYYAGRPLHAWNNCYAGDCLEDTREEWGRIVRWASDALMLGGGIGVCYSRLRGKGSLLSRTGGKSSGPIPLMKSVNEIGRNVMQGGSRRSAIYGSLHWWHPDVEDFLVVKNWAQTKIGRARKGNTEYTLQDAKLDDFNFPAPLDMTNISVNYDDAFLDKLAPGDPLPGIWVKNCRQALMTGEPGMSFNFGAKQNEYLRNAPVSSDTWVMTDSGYRQIKDIVGVPVKVWTGVQWADTTFKKTASNAEIIRVGMTGRRIIKAEPSHEFKVRRYPPGPSKCLEDSWVESVPASKLCVGDHLVVSLPNHTRTKFNSLAYTMGFIYGDGTIQTNGRSELTLCTPDKKECLQFMDHTNISSITEEDSRGYTRIYFNKFCAAESKHRLPDTADVGFIRSFLAGLFDADGSYDKSQHRIRVSSTSSQLLNSVRRWLDFIGIQSNVNKGSNGGYKDTPTWSLVISASSVSRFCETIPCHRLKPESYTPFRDSHIKVVSLEVYEPEDVYCCDVGVPEHTFCAEGVIISNCCEFTTTHDSDICNLGSINLANIESLDELASVVTAATWFLLCGSIRADLPGPKFYEVREKSRRIGLGLMGVHEWLLRRGYKYEVNEELQKWLQVYAEVSTKEADYFCIKHSISPSTAQRAVAPTGTIGIMASTTTGIEPLFATAFKRRYLVGGSQWKFEYVVDATADLLINELGLKPEDVETASDLAADYERRIAFQAGVQDYVDMAISSTINLPEWGSNKNNEDVVLPFAQTLAKYMTRLRGFTCYPNGSRGGQPLTPVEYGYAKKHKGVVFDEVDICDITNRGGTCGS